MLTIDQVQKYSATWGRSAEDESLIERIRAIREEVTKFLACAQAYQACTYNKSHCYLEYNFGQKVWLRVKKITIERLSRKLDWQWYSPYFIIEKIGKVAYRLDLPTSLIIHNVFHFSLFRDHKLRVSEESSEPQPLSLAIDLAVQGYDVEAIFASQIKPNPLNLPVLQYKIAWKGYIELTWEAAANLKHSRRLVTSSIKRILKYLVMSDPRSPTTYFRWSSVSFSSKVILNLKIQYIARCFPVPVFISKKSHHPVSNSEYPEQIVQEDTVGGASIS